MYLCKKQPYVLIQKQNQNLADKKPTRLKSCSTHKIPLLLSEKYSAQMSSLQLQNTIFRILPKLTESQLNKLVEFINTMLAVQKPRKVIKPAPEKMRSVKIFTDESFDLEQDEIHTKLPFHSTFIVQAKVIAVEKPKPVIILE